MLTDAQVRQLLKPIHPQRVYEKDGQSHLTAWDVTAHLTRMFGFEGWDKHVVDLTQLYENREEYKRNNQDKIGFHAGYRATVRLTIRDPEGNVVKVTEDSATGTATRQPTRADAHDLAVKAAISQAEKRCAKDLGDQFGLSLYNSGSRTPVVVASFAYGDPTAVEPPEVKGDADEPGTENHAAEERPEDASSRPAPRRRENNVVSINRKTLDEIRQALIDATDVATLKAAWDFAGEKDAQDAEIADANSEETTVRSWVNSKLAELRGQEE